MKRKKSVFFEPYEGGTLVEIFTGGNYISAVVNLNKWFMFRKVRLISARGLNYDYARKLILEEYKAWINQNER